MAKSKGKVGFSQPDHGGSAPMPVAEDKLGVAQGRGAKTKKAQPVGPPAKKFSSVSSLLSYRKKKYGV